MTIDFDVVVIGSGFGGAVVACRLAEAGYKVCILERGRRWGVENFPRLVEDDWFWDHNHPERASGWFDLRFYPHMAIVQGAAVGGGSLHYANVSIEARPDLFEKGWPPEITYGELKPYYNKAGQMLDARVTPESNWGERTRLMKKAAEARGYSSRFRLLEVAVSFDEAWNYDLPDAHNEKHSKEFVNAQGQKQGTCVHTGYCDLGCPVLAKNTLDLNYIARAEKFGAEVRPLHMARRIEPLGDGTYRIGFDRIEPGQLTPGSVAARIVVMSAGSLGSSELLLRCRDEYKTLPAISPMLGRHWSSNGDFLTPAIHAGLNVDPSHGLPIVSGIDFLGPNHLEEGIDFLIEDGGFPDVFGAALQERLKLAFAAVRPLRVKALANLKRFVGWLLRQSNPLAETMLWFANGRDAADGRLSLRKQWWLFGEQRLHLDWNLKRSEKFFNAVESMQFELARTTGGEPRPSLAWTLFKDLATPHPLGGCKMGTSKDNGVVDHRGEVFGYKNLYVADGAIIPRAIGNNPSRTIAALSERIAKLIIDEVR